MSEANPERNEAAAGQPLGQAWLRAHFALPVPRPSVESYVVAGARRSEMFGDRAREYYPRAYATGADPIANLRFALRYEPFDLRILVGALDAIGPQALEDWVRAEPTGAYARRSWFLYEHLLGRRLDLSDATSGNYVFALDPEKHVVGARRNSQRHRVANNLLGPPAFCPTVRRTPRLADQMALQVDVEARALVESYDPALLSRAVNYLYSKETRSSFAIEGETPSPQRAERFIAALQGGASFDAGNKAAIIQLQNAIVDPRYAAHDWRDFQNFVSSTTVDFQENVHFICPRPQDVASLMDGWMELTQRLLDSSIDPVIAAATTAFAFVFIHPFEDGNGRIHRFLIHHVLSRTGFSPRNIIFPVSASIVRDQRGYDEVLESFSQPLLSLIDWRWTADQKIVVRNDTAPLYRFFDATRFAEYLYDRVIDTVHIDLKEELGFLAVFDRALEAVRDIVDMPDRRASLLIRLMLQNGGRLSQAKRRQFDELTDEEIGAMEIALQRARTASEH